uniref:Uncharacterized protein n=1 Tax=Meloidogyne javanica TaxID=6303 RepID=A0A915LPV4_MELJA
MAVFSEFTEKFYTQWILMNCFTDAINVLDLFVKIKKGFTVDGGNNRYISIRKYIFCRAFLLDLLAILPTDILLLIWPNLFLLRINRLAKIGRVSEIVKLIEHRIPWPLGFRLLRLATFFLYMDLKNLFQILPPRLGLELAAESHVRALIGSPVFSLCERALLSELAIRLQTLRLCPGDIAMFIVKYGRLEMPIDDEFTDEQSFYTSTERESSSLNFFQRTVRSVGYSLLFVLEREAMAVAFDEYPHSRRMVRRKAKLICQQYEQRWKRKDSLSSYDSAAEFNISSSNQQNKSNELMDKREDEEADDDCYYFMEHSSSSIEERLNEIQRNVNLINAELGIAERNFLRSSSELKQLMTAVEKDYQQQRPNLKQMLGMKQFWKRRKVVSTTKTLINKPELIRQELENNYFDNEDI